MNKEYTKEQWLEEGRKRFGDDFENWKFICPKCGNIAGGIEFKNIGVEINSIYTECIGRHVKEKGCNWAAYGLFDICTVHVEGMPVFDFAPSDTNYSTERGGVQE